MKKEIYIIKNDINEKVYVGQSVNSKQRFTAHVSNGKTKTRVSLIDQAIEKYGKEHFWYEIIEETEDYNEREQFWIKYFNSLRPNGYNITVGGEGEGNGIYSQRALIKDEKELFNIIKDLKENKIKQIEIAKKYGYSSKIISAINRGAVYRIETESYPLRKRESDFKTKEEKIQEKEEQKKRVEQSKIKEKEIKEALKNSSKSLRQIARDLGYSYSSVQGINCGKYFYDGSLSYPIKQ